MVPVPQILAPISLPATRAQDQRTREALKDVHVPRHACFSPLHSLTLPACVPVTGSP